MLKKRFEAITKKIFKPNLGPATSTIVAFEVMIGHNSRPGCTRESVKTSSNSEDSNVSFEVCCTYF